MARKMSRLQSALGVVFVFGDQGTGGYDALDPISCGTLEKMRILDFAGYGTYYPRLSTVELDVYCGDASTHLWNSGPYETGSGWNYIPVDPPLCFPACWENPFPGHFDIIVTATMTGTEGVYPTWGMDNISTPFLKACEFHDVGCLPALWPRTAPGMPHLCRSECQ